MYQTDNTTLHSLLIDTIWTKRDRLVAIAEQEFWVRHSTSRDVVANWVDGFIAVLIQALQGPSGEYRRFYVERIIHDGIDNGTPHTALLRMVVAWSVLVTHEITQDLPAASRSDAVHWFSGFFAGYAFDFAQAGQGQRLSE